MELKRNFYDNLVAWKKERTRQCLLRRLQNLRYNFFMNHEIH